MAGSFLRQIKKTPEIAPLVLIVSGACVGAIGMTIRAAMTNPDASWDRANNQHPWLKIKPNEQVKLYSHSDYSKFESDRPSDPGKSDWTDPRKNENMTDKIMKTTTVRVCDNVKKNIIYCAFKWLIQHTSV